MNVIFFDFCCVTNHRNGGRRVTMPWECFPINLNCQCYPTPPHRQQQQLQLQRQLQLWRAMTRSKRVSTHCYRHAAARTSLRPWPPLSRLSLPLTSWCAVKINVLRVVTFACSFLQLTFVHTLYPYRIAANHAIIADTVACTSSQRSGTSGAPLHRQGRQVLVQIARHTPRHTRATCSLATRQITAESTAIQSARCRRHAHAP